MPVAPERVACVGSRTAALLSWEIEALIHELKGGVGDGAAAAGIDLAAGLQLPRQPEILQLPCIGHEINSPFDD